MMETKAFNASRAVRETMVLPYDEVRDRLIALRGEEREGFKGILSDKIAAEMCGVSERQIRKARRFGMNPYLADHLCVRGLGLLPGEVFGQEVWLNAEAFFAEDLYRKKIKPEDIPSRDEAEVLAMAQAS